MTPLVGMAWTGIEAFCSARQSRLLLCNWRICSTRSDQNLSHFKTKPKWLLNICWLRLLRRTHELIKTAWAQRRAKGNQQPPVPPKCKAATRKHAVPASRWGSPGVRKQTCQKPAAGQQPVAKPERKQPEEPFLKISIHSISLVLQSGSQDFLKLLSTVIYTLDKSPVHLEWHTTIRTHSCHRFHLTWMFLDWL